MQIDVQLTRERIGAGPCVLSEPVVDAGAWIEFHGAVRGQENGQPITAIEYEAYPEMAIHQLRHILEELKMTHPCLAVQVVHRLGLVPVGETAIYVRIAATHRTEAFSMLAGFMDRLKQDVPIWKLRALAAANAQICVAAGANRLDAGSTVEFQMLAPALRERISPLQTDIQHVPLSKPLQTDE